MIVYKTEKRGSLSILYFVIFALFFSLLISVIKIEHALWAILVISFSFILFIYLKKKELTEKELRSIFYLSLIGFGIRVFIVIVCTIYPSLTFPSDAGSYEVAGLQISSDLMIGKITPGIFSQHFLYYILNGLTFYSLGFYPSVLRILNCFLGVFAGINVYLATRKLFGNPASKISAFLMFFFPSFIFWQSLNLKEAMVSFLLTLIIRNMTYIKENLSKKILFQSIIAILLLILTRSYVGLFLGGIVCIYFLFTSKYRFFYKVGIVCGVTLALAAVTYKAGMGILGFNILKTFNLSYIDIIRKSNYQGGSEVLLNYSMGTPLDLIKFLPIAIVYFIFSPFPWQSSGSLVQFFAAGENVIWYVIFPFFILGTWKGLKKDKTIIITLLFILFGLSTFYSIIMGNMGIAYRFKDQLLPLAFILASFGIAKVNQRVTKI